MKFEQLTTRSCCSACRHLRDSLWTLMYNYLEVKIEWGQGLPHQRRERQGMLRQLRSFNLDTHQQLVRLERGHASQITRHLRRGEPSQIRKAKYVGEQHTMRQQQSARMAAIRKLLRPGRRLGHAIARQSLRRARRR